MTEVTRSASGRGSSVLGQPIDAGHRRQQRHQIGVGLHQHRGAPLRQQRRIADELQHVAAALFGQNQDPLAGDPRNVEHDGSGRPLIVSGHIEPVFVGRPAICEVTQQQQAQAHVPDDGFLIGVPFQEPAARRQSLLRPPETQQRPPDLVGDIRQPLHRGIERRDPSALCWPRATPPPAGPAASAWWRG